MNFETAFNVYMESTYGPRGDDYNGYSRGGSVGFGDADSFAVNYVNVIDADGNATPITVTYNDIKTVFDDISNAFTFTDHELTFSGDNRSDSISFNFDDTVLPSGMDYVSLEFNVVGQDQSALTLSWQPWVEVQSLNDFNLGNQS